MITAVKLGGGGGECELEEPADQACSIVNVVKDEVSVTNEGQLGAIGTSVGEGITDSPESNSTSTSIQNILEHDILHVLSTDRSGTEHGKTSLHEEDHRSGKEEVEHIKTSVGGIETRLKFFYGGHFVLVA